MSDNSKVLFKSFILDIVKVFPEYEKRLKKQYSNIFEEDQECNDIISSFYENVEEISKELSENKFSVFEDDPILLNNLSFKLIWNSNISNETKNNIWRYLQTFCVYNINNKLGKGKGEVEDVLNSIKQKEKISDKSTLNNMKLLKKLSESLNSNIVLELLTKGEINETPKKEIPEENKNPMNIPGMDGMEDILENSSIGKIAKEVSEELNIESMISSGEGIESLMNGDNMMNIFKSISQKIENNDGGNILEEAMDISKNMKDNPLFSSLMSTMSGSMANMEAGLDNMKPPQNPDNRRINLSNNHDGSATKKRLQRKLQEKNEGKIDVNKKD